MTTINVSGPRSTAIVASLTDAGVRAPTGIGMTPGAAVAVLTWTPDLSAAEQTTVSLISQLAVGSTLISPAERNALEPDFAGLRTYQGIASPTLAQTVSAVKAQSRVLRAILRDG